MSLKLLCLVVLMCTSVFAQGVAPQTISPRPSASQAAPSVQPYRAGENIINYVDFSFNLGKFVDDEGIDTSLYFSASRYFNEFLGAAAVIEMIRGNHAGNAIGVALSAKYPIYDDLQGYALVGPTYLYNPDGADGAIGPFFELGVRFLARGLYVKCSLRYISAESEYRGETVNLRNTSMMVGLGLRFY